MKNNTQNITILPNELFFSEVKKIIQSGSKVKISVSGNSMKPFLREGDFVVLDKFEKKNLSCGDVVLAYYNRSYVLHRVVGMRADVVILAGDGNFFQVEKVDVRDILAIVIDASRNEKAIKFKSIRWKIWYKFKFVRYIYSKIFN